MFINYNRARQKNDAICNSIEGGTQCGAAGICDDVKYKWGAKALKGLHISWALQAVA